LPTSTNPRIHESALVIPEEAILARSARNGVRRADQQAMIRSCETGLRVPGKVQIIEGLSPAGSRDRGHQKLFQGRSQGCEAAEAKPDAPKSN